MISRWKLTLAALGVMAATFPAADGEAQSGKPAGGSGRGPSGADEPQLVERTEVMTPQVKEAIGWANDFAREATQIMEKWIDSGAISEDKMFSYLYYPILDTDPTKYNTDYDALSDRDLTPVLDKYFSKTGLMLYAVVADKNGYVPTHNRPYSEPLTGNRAVDLVRNRTKRLFGDSVGFKDSRNTEAYLVQQYKRDTGELAANVSVPIKLKGRHWGCIRIGFRQTDR